MGFESLESPDKWSFVFALNLKAHLTILSLPPNLDEDQKQRTYKCAIERYLRTSNDSLTLETAANRDTWVAANNVSGTARVLGYLDMGLNFLNDVNIGTMNIVTPGTIEDRFLETMGYTTQELFLCTTSPDGFRRARLRKQVDTLYKSLSQVLVQVGLELLDTIADPAHKFS